MPKQTSKKSTMKAKAQKLLRESISDRSDLVGNIGEAAANLEAQVKVSDELAKKKADSDARVNELAGALVAAYESAIAGGWTEAELKQLDVDKPDVKSAIKAATESLANSHKKKATENAEVPAADPEPAETVEDAPEASPEPDHSHQEVSV
ncbi:hypothetical protein [Mycobacteroides abscessus]|uniref:hypothetical protein n=1 Tax=Mycobacteroides abscessus TaxID=36809 RepID=UPI0009D51A6D|nr:hypothetical protein [Mycobacteroides abscessus]SKK35937.1 Uncharacterised protein [Mycobacteroides abscessus subsp. abscessus]